MNNIFEEYSGIVFIPVVLIILELFIKIMVVVTN